MSDNQQPKKVLKKIKHKRPLSQGSRIPPSKSVPDSTEASIKALLAEDSSAQTSSSPQPSPATTDNGDDEFERLLNEFINAELDDAQENAQESLDNVTNGQVQEPIQSLPLSNTDEENSNLLEDPEKSLYRAYQNYFFAIRAIAENTRQTFISPSLTAENLYPHYKPRIGIRISKEIMQGWEIMLQAFPQELSSLNPGGSDDELLDFAEQATDENMQLAIISYVEILIEMEGCDIQYETRKLKAERRKIEKEIFEAHQARVERSQKYIDAIKKKEFPIDAERLVKNFEKTSNKDAEGAYKMLTTNPATFSPIEINKIKPRFFGLVKVTPQDGIRVNREIGEFIKRLKV